jgi:hypothetical protein
MTMETNEAKAKDPAWDAASDRLKELFEAEGRLSNAVMLLSMSLGPILKPAETGEKKEYPTPSGSPLLQSVIAVAQNLDGYANALEALTRRLDL